MSWGLVDTVVLKARASKRQVVVKAGGTKNHHIGREIRAHREWSAPWARQGRSARLLHADESANVLVTSYLPGRLVQGDAAAGVMDTYVQAGQLLRPFHSQLAEQDEEYEARANAKSLKCLEGEHRIHAGTVDRLVAMVRSWPEPPVTLVPTHGDWQARNWLVDDACAIRVVGFGRAVLRPAAEDLERLAAQEFLWHPGAEEAFLSGYGSDPREPDAWFRQRVRAAVGTAVWAFQVGDEDFEAQGHRMINDVLAKTDS